MNTSTFDFSSMSTDDLLRFARALAYEMYQRCEPVKTFVCKAVKVVKSWFF